jgi:hypothetical protein
MSNWFTKNLGDPLLATQALELIKSRCLEEYEKLNRPNDMAIFFRHETIGGLHCEVILYFSPAAASLAGSVGAVSCARPSADDLGILVGSEEGMAQLFTR